jgi:ribosomal protein S13
MKVETVKVNGIAIECPIEGGQSYVAVKPICEALGIDHSAQIRDLKEDEILGSVVVSMTTTGSDGKQYQMVCIPLKFVFGWLFSINENSVKPEAKEHVLKYKLECYNVLFNHFFGNVKKQLEANEIKISLLEKINALNEKKNFVASELRENRAKLVKIREERLKNEPDLFD